jgi:hypothetical protein|tara:strand:+ start:183 stop:848 length:666 start_codon:yes stop_codon:yes gene_type:complete
MFDNLVNFTPNPAGVGDFIPFEKAAPVDILDAQVATDRWLKDLGVPSDTDLDTKSQQNAAREAFTSLNFDVDNAKQRTALAVIKTPAAVQHLSGMLTAYDWEFVNQAKELRGYTVSKILEETKHPDARIRLKALQMLGNVTEVALFTERVEVIKKDASEEEIEKRLRDRLAKFLTPIDGATVTDVTPVSEPMPFAIPEAGNEGEGMTLDAEIGIVAERRNA